MHSPSSSGAAAGDPRFMNGTPPDDMMGEPMDVDLKRKMDEIEGPQKRLRVDDLDENIP